MMPAPSHAPAAPAAPAPEASPAPAARCSNASPRAFTLVELLVVLAVVALLIGILLPVLGGARRRAAAVACLSNARQIATAVTAFADDNKGKLPENRVAVSATEHVTWRHLFAQDGRLPAGDVWACPAHPGDPYSELGQVDWTTTCVGDVASSYALNGHLLWARDRGPEEADRPIVTIARPSHTILITETRAQFPDLRVIDMTLAYDDALGGFYGFWHFGNGTYAFADGHAEAQNIYDTGSPDCRWHNGRDLTQDPNDPQEPAELRIHDHPDWRYLLDDVYTPRR